MVDNYISLNYKEDKERELFAKQYAKYVKRVYFKDTGKLLDVGFCRGWYMEGFGSLGYDVSGVEIDNEAVEIASKKGLKVKAYDGVTIPFEDNTFDFIFCKSVIEHIDSKNIISFIGELKRVLKKGGILYLYTPNWRTNYKKFYRDFTHKTPFDYQSLIDVLKINKFEDIVIKEAGHLKYVWRYSDLAFNFRSINSFNLEGVAKR